MSVFILDGAELRATASIEGPIAPLNITSGVTFHEAIEQYDRGTRFGLSIFESHVVDFEHIHDEARAGNDDDDALGDDDTADAYMSGFDDDDAGPETPEDMTPEKVEQMKRRAAEKRRQLNIARQRARETRRKREEKRKARLAKVRDEGEPFQKTVKASDAGWYRMCLRGTWYQVSAV